MRIVIFVVLIVVTLLITAFFCWREFILPEIDFVDDCVETGVENQIIVKRLYAAYVDEEAYSEALYSIQNMTEDEFEEDEVLAAARKSGMPEFYPAFIIDVYRNGDDIFLKGFIDVKLAEGQEELKFKLGNINFEALTRHGLTIENFDITSFEGVNGIKTVKINSDNAVAADLSKASGFEIKMTGAGSVTLQFVYTIESDTFMPRTALEEQLLQIHADISTDDDGKLKAIFTPEPYSNLEDLENE